MRPTVHYVPATDRRPLAPWMRFALYLIAISLATVAILAGIGFALEPPARHSTPVAVRQSPAVTRHDVSVTQEPRLAPPVVEVHPDVTTVDRDDAQAYVTRVINDQRSWGADFHKVTFKIVSDALVRQVCGEGAGACAGGYLGQVVLMSESGWIQVCDCAPDNVSLDDQRAWYINHELGHLLGHDHSDGCGVMRPYEITDGCSFIAWPANGI